MAVIRLVLGSFLLITLLANPSAARSTYAPCIEGLIHLESDPGELIGLGETLDFDEADADPFSAGFGFFAVTEDPVFEGIPGVVRILFRGLEHHWNFDFSSKELGEGLRTGDYEGATRYPFELDGVPGLSVSGNHRGWGQLAGSFTVLELSFLRGQVGFPPALGRFAAEFEQRGYDFEEALRGRVECYHSLLVPLDVRPRKRWNPLDITSDRPVRIALLGTEEFDVEELDRVTLRFGPKKAEPVHDLPAHLRDVNRDGYADLVVHVVPRELGVTLAGEDVCLTGSLLDGRPLEGCDSVRPTLGFGPTTLAIDPRDPGSGWFSSEGSHAVNNENTVTGSVSSREYNSFFVWDVSLVPPERVVGVKLVLGQDRINTREASEILEVRDVETPVASLFEDYAAGNADGMAIHEDLETGDLYGSFEATRETLLHEVLLSEEALRDLVDAIEGSGWFAVGLHNATDERDRYDDYVRFDLHPPVQQLVLEIGPRWSWRSRHGKRWSAGVRPRR
jgi:hypothetical protein